MMRLRRAPALVVLSVLASAATAYAECAWVLWALGADAVAGGSESLSAVAECWTGRLIQVGRSSWQSLLYLATIWSLILS